MTAMNKNALVQRIAQRVGLPKGEVKLIIDSYFDFVKRNLKENNKITIAGYGTIMPINQKGRLARNPKTGDPIILKTRRSVKFKPSPQFIDSLNKPKENE